jgi:hypothetical protein
MRQWFGLLVLAMAPLGGFANTLANVDIVDRTSGRVLPIHEYRGRLYVAGEPGHQYELRIRNQSTYRLLAVTSVDGVNVVSGQTAAPSQRGYVIDAYDSVAIEGWRKSLDEVATFYFTHLTDSYAARTARPDNVGVIGVALFREKVHRRCCEYPQDRAASQESAHADEAVAAAESAGDQRQKRNSPLGTGHGQLEVSPAQYVDFRRASMTPDKTIVIYYDSRRSLVAQGVLAPGASLAQRQPEPFPDGFVADP